MGTRGDGKGTTRTWFLIIRAGTRKKERIVTSITEEFCRREYRYETVRSSISQLKLDICLTNLLAIRISRKIDKYLRALILLPERSCQ